MKIPDWQDQIIFSLIAAFWTFIFNCCVLAATGHWASYEWATTFYFVSYFGMRILDKVKEQGGQT